MRNTVATTVLGMTMVSGTAGTKHITWATNNNGHGPLIDYHKGNPGPGKACFNTLSQPQCNATIEQTTTAKVGDKLIFMWYDPTKIIKIKDPAKCTKDMYANHETFKAQCAADMTDYSLNGQTTLVPKSGEDSVSVGASATDSDNCAPDDANVKSVQTYAGEKPDGVQIQSANHCEYTYEVTDNDAEYICFYGKTDRCNAGEYMLVKRSDFSAAAEPEAEKKVTAVTTDTTVTSTTSGAMGSSGSIGGVLAVMALMLF